MTVIVAAATRSGIIVAADRLVTSSWQKSYHDEPKLWVSGQWVLGCAGSLRTAQVLKHHVSWPKYRPTEDEWETFLVKTLVPAIRSGVNGHGVLSDNNGVQQLAGQTTLLVATGNHLALVAYDGCVLSDTTGRTAIGSGCPEALGAIGDEGPWTEDDVVRAVRRAAITDRGVGGAISVTDTETLTIRTLPARDR